MKRWVNGRRGRKEAISLKGKRVDGSFSLSLSLSRWLFNVLFSSSSPSSSSSLLLLLLLPPLPIPVLLSLLLRIDTPNYVLFVCVILKRKK